MTWRCVGNQDITKPTDGVTEKRSGGFLSAQREKNTFQRRYPKRPFPARKTFSYTAEHPVFTSSSPFTRSGLSPQGTICHPGNSIPILNYSGFKKYGMTITHALSQTQTSKPNAQPPGHSSSREYFSEEQTVTRLRVVYSNNVQTYFSEGIAACRTYAALVPRGLQERLQGLRLEEWSMHEPTPKKRGFTTLFRATKRRARFVYNVSAPGHYATCLFHYMVLQSLAAVVDTVMSAGLSGCSRHVL